MTSLFTVLRRRKWVALPVGAAIAAALAYSLSPTGHAAPKISAPAPVAVKMVAAGQEDFPVWLDAAGTVTSFNVVNVRSRVDGQLERVAFQEGQMVHAGDLLAVIDPRPLQAQVNQSAATLAQEQAKLASNQVDLKRAAGLAAAGAGPTQAVDTLRAQVATQTAAVQAARAALDSARLQLGFTRITAPIDGRIGQRLVPPGSMVHATDAVGIATITQMNPIWTSFPVPQDQLPLLLDGNQARPLRVEVLSRDRTRSLAAGVLDFVDSQVTPAVGQVTLKARFDNAGPALWPGELVAVRMLVQTHAKAVVVPDQALQQGPQGPFVYVVDAGHVAQVRQVSTGEAFKGMRRIQAGLRTGEIVIAQGQYRVEPGVEVEQLAAPAASDAVASAAGAEQ
ncbi:efflux RND transporter periplasmic adaptor subunit [Achromobacter aloeverae]